MFKYTLSAFLLITSLLIASSQQQFGEPKAVPECQNNGDAFCLSCSVQAACISVGGELQEFDVKCDAGAVCNSAGVCETSGAVTDCTCKSGTGIRYQADPYNDHWFIVCIDNAPPTYVDCGPQYFDGNIGCGDDPPMVCPGPGLYADMNDPTCAGFLICEAAESPPIYEQCPPIAGAPGYFDTLTNTCSTLPPPFICFDNGAFRDPYDCNKYYVCVGTTQVGEYYCDPGFIFDDKQATCVPDDGSCRDIVCFP